MFLRQFYANLRQAVKSKFRRRHVDLTPLSHVFSAAYQDSNSGHPVPNFSHVHRKNELSFLDLLAGQPTIFIVFNI